MNGVTDEDDACFGNEHEWKGAVYNGAIDDKQFSNLN